MSTQQLKQAVQQTKKDLATMKPSEKIQHILESRKDAIAAMLPKHLGVERLLKVAMIAATSTPALLECEVPSLVQAVANCALLGLEPNTPLGHAYLIPFNAKKSGQWVKNVQVVIGYKGLIDLARRSGHIVSIAAHEVCERDIFELEYGLDEKLRHVPNLTGDRGQIIGFYAVAHLKDGGHAFDYMPLSDVDKIRDASQGFQAAQKYSKDHPWISHFAEMGKKTMVRRLSKMLPLSIEFAAAAAYDEELERGQATHLESISGELMAVADDGEIIDMETGEIHTSPSIPSDNGIDWLSVDTLIKRVNESKDQAEAAEVMALPDVDHLAPADIKKLSLAYQDKIGKL